VKGYFDPRQLAHAPALELHNGAFVPHADVPLRAESVVAALPWLEAPRDHGEAAILAVHDAGYVDFLKNGARLWAEAGRPGEAIGYIFPVVGRRPLRLSRIDALLGQYSFDSATPLTPDAWDASYWSTQSALSALDTVLGGARAAFALGRPPGHHAGRDYLGGYCYLNYAAVTAQAARDAGVARVAILDIDYHHGNGTQDIFWERGDVFYAATSSTPRSMPIRRPTIPSTGAMPTRRAKAREQARRSIFRSRRAPVSPSSARRRPRRSMRLRRSTRGCWS
jgi:acetoin utilization deacetylase AcuC-like enzyme